MRRVVDCARCQQAFALAKGLCSACYHYQRKHGRARPSYLFDGEPRRCLWCKMAVKPGGQSRFLCGACYMRDWRQRRASLHQSVIHYDDQGNPWTQLPLPAPSRRNRGSTTT